MSIPGSPTGTDADTDSGEAKALAILSYPSRIWRSALGSLSSLDRNLLSKIGISNIYGRSLSFLSRTRRHGLPLPLHSTSPHTFRIMSGDTSRALAILEDIVEHTLSHLHNIQKSLLFWQSRAEGTSSQKIYHMIFERGPRAFVNETYKLVIKLASKGSPVQYISSSASDMISKNINVLTNLQHCLSTFLAEVYLEVNQYREVLTENSEKSLPTALVIIDALFSKLESLVGHPPDFYKDGSACMLQFEKLPETNLDRLQWTETEINNATNLIYQNLQTLNSFISSKLSIHQKPKKVTLHWVQYTCGAVGLTVCSVWILKHSSLMGSSDIDNWIRDAKDSMIGFYKEHVELPLISIRDELFETFKKRQKGVMEAQEVQLTSDSLHRMLLTFSEQTKGQKQPDNVSDQELMEIVMARYEKELMHPLQNLLSGELARAMLIQIQKLKLDLETAMLELDQILKANEINFAILAALPAFFISLLLLMLIRAWLLQDKGAEGRGRIARRQRRLLLIEVEKRLFQLQSCMDQGTEEEARCRFGLMLYSLDRLYKSVEWHAKETGEWLSLRQDIIDLAKPDIGTAQKLAVVSRLQRMYDCLLPSSRRF